MADGSQGGMSGVLFEAGKSLGNSTKQAAKTVFQDTTSQVTGQTFTPKQQGSNPKPNLGSLPPLPKFDNLGGIPGLFEKNGGKQNAFAQQQQQALAQQQLTQMAEQNKAADEAKIRELTQKLHNETYYNKIAQSGGSIAQERHDREQKDIMEEEQRKNAKEQQLSEPLLPGKLGGMLGKILKKPSSSARSSTHETPKKGG